METKESSSSAKNPITPMKPGSPDTSISKEGTSSSATRDSFFEAIKEKTKKRVLEAYDILLILLKSTVIFGLFLLCDKFLLWLITSDAAGDITISHIFQATQVISAIIVSSAYIAHFLIKMYKHREEILGISKKKGGS